MKKLFLAACALVAATQAWAQTQPAPPDVKLTITLQELAIMGEALGELPLKKSAGLFSKIRAQVEAQEAERKAAAEKPSEPRQ